MRISLNLMDNVAALVEASLYDSLMQSYGSSKAEKIIKDVELKENNTALQVNSFLSEALLMGKNPYDLKRGLLSSPKAKISEKVGTYLTVPVSKDSFATVTSKSDGWIHPGFDEKNWLPLFHYILSSRLLEAMLS